MGGGWPLGPAGCRPRLGNSLTSRCHKFEDNRAAQAKGGELGDNDAGRDGPPSPPGTEGH